MNIPHTDVRNPIPSNQGDLVARCGETWNRQIEQIRAKFGQDIEEIRTPPEYPTDVPIIYVKKTALLALLEFLKSTPEFEYSFLSDLTATDEEVEPRFEVVYNLLAMARRMRIRVKTRVRDGEDCPSATGIWPGANWIERECYDMFGVRFAGHPDLRRILMDERWVGYPLRKDYPLRGYQIFPDSLPPRPELLDKDGVT